MATETVRTLSDITFVVFDLETTGLTPVMDRIVEIGAVKFRNGEVIETFQELIDPQMPISAGAFAVNGITDEVVRGKPTIEEILPQFIEFLDHGLGDVGAADKAAIQLVKVQPYQLLVSDT